MARLACPACGDQSGLLKGPRGGESVNLKCPKCGRIFLYSSACGLSDPEMTTKFDAFWVEE